MFGPPQWLSPKQLVAEVRDDELLLDLLGFLRFLTDAKLYHGLLAVVEKKVWVPHSRPQHPAVDAEEPPQIKK
jgi:hypothetical protein